MSCDNKTCDTCGNYSAKVDRKNRLTMKCTRLQTKTCNPIFKGVLIFDGPLLDCRVERCLVQTWREWLFGPSKTPKCGEKGNFWTEVKV